jgi:outer membrane protein TolC
VASARAERSAARSRVAQETAALFARCLSGTATLGAAEAKLVAMQAVEARGDRLRQEGRATELDSRRATLHVAQARQQLGRARSEHELAELALARRLGLAVPLRLEPEPRLPETGADSADDLSVARAADPRLRALAEQIVAEERARRIRGRLIAPVIELGADYSRLYKTADWDDFYRSFKPDAWSLGASIRLPLFAGNARAVETARGQARLDRLQAERAARERDLELEVRRAQAEIAAAKEGLEVARLAQALADEDLRVSIALLGEGRVDAAERAEKQQAVAEAGRDQALARGDLLLAEAKRLSLRGELAAEPAVTLPANR